MSVESDAVGSRHNVAARPHEREDWGGLIARTAAGDETALAALYDATSALVYGLTLRILGDTALAEEVAADVYMQVWRHAERYDPARGAPLSWLLTLARSRAIDRRRVAAGETWRAAQLGEAIALPSPTPGPEEHSEVTERRTIVRQALDALGPEQRRAIELSYFGGLSHSEIAAALCEPLGTVKTRIRLGMVRMREVLTRSVGDAL